VSSKVTRGADLDEYDETELNDSFDPHSLSMRLPEPDQSESVETDPLVERDEAVAVELFDPDELNEMLDPKDRRDPSEDAESSELVEWEAAIESSDPVIPVLCSILGFSRNGR
jgi:hypothetical protein